LLSSFFFTNFSAFVRGHGGRRGRTDEDERRLGTPMARAKIASKAAKKLAKVSKKKHIRALFELQKGGVE
jgi:hypothetical protein